MRMSKTVVLSSCLFLSLAANLLLGSMLAGKHAAPTRAHPNPPQHGDLFTQKSTKSLPPKQRQKIEESIRPQQKALAAKRKEMRQQQEQIRKLILQPKIDRAQLEEAFARYRALSGEAQVIAQSVMVDTALALPAKDRKQWLAPKGGGKPATGPGDRK